MIQEELFVGLTAVLLGGAGLAAAALNWEPLYQLRKAQWIEAKWGRTATRCVFGLIGIALILMGLTIALGFGPNTRRGDSRSTVPVRGGANWRGAEAQMAVFY